MALSAVDTLFQMPKMKPPSISIRSQQCPVVGRAADLGGAAILRPWLCSEVLVVAHAERSKSQWCYIIQTESVVQCSAGFTPLVSWLIATTEFYTADLSINDNPKQNHLRISVNQMIHHFTPMHGGMINLRRSAVVWCNRATLPPMPRIPWHWHGSPSRRPFLSRP